LKSFDSDKIITWSVLLAAVLFRFAALSLKPPHGDEGVNGHFVILMWQNGYFSYDPTNYHGPLLFNLFQISEKIFGFGVHSFRIVTASFSLLTVWLVLQSREVLGRYASYFAALALALSPGMIFFGRSGIHEPAYVFFQVLWIIGFMKLRERMDRPGLQWFLLGLVGCFLLKETFVILGASLLLAWGWTEASPRILGVAGKTVGSPPKGLSPGFTKPFLLKMIFLTVFVWLAFFTGFFQHWKGASDSFVALMPWLKTGVGGAGHNKPFSHWLSLFGKYEWVGAVGIAGAFIGVVSRSWKLRFLSFLALLNGLIYSWIPYKTPWCMISILWPFVLVAGIWIEFIFDKFPARYSPVFLSSMAVAAVLVGRSAVAAYTLNFVHYADTSPYVYVQVKNDYKVLEAVVQKKIRSAPDARNMIVQSCLNESWPLPWFFSRFPNYRYGGPGDAFDLKSDIILSEVFRTGQELPDLYLQRKIDLREARELIYVYLKKSTFQGIDLPGFDTFQAAGGKGL
jgi:uncharacterized protein (TIGR03663 family)